MVPTKQNSLFPSLFWIFFILQAMFIILPLLYILKIAFFEDLTPDFKPALSLFSSPNDWHPFINSMILGICVGMSSTLIGLAYAYGIVRIELRFRQLYHFLALVPLVSPPFLVSISMILLFGRNGIITSAFLGINEPLIYGFPGLFIVETFSYFPISYLMLLGVIKSIPASFEEASKDLGASDFQIFRGIFLPLIKPGILNSFLVVFSTSLADFANPLILGGKFHVMTLWAYLKIVGEYDMQGGALMALLLIAPSLVVFFIQRFFVEKGYYSIIGGKSMRKPAPLKNRAAKVWWNLFFAASAVATLILFGTIFIGAFVETPGNNYSLTLKHVLYSWRIGGNAFFDSLIISLLSTPLATFLGLILAYFTERFKSKRTILLETCALVPFILPGTVLGIGYVLAFNHLPILLTGTSLIIILCLIFRDAPVGFRAGVSCLKQINKKMEEASIDLGASQLSTLKNIILPLIYPAFFAGISYSFIRAITAISAVIFLVSARWQLLTVLIMDQVESGRSGVAAALSAVLVIICVATLSALNWFISRKQYYKLSDFHG